jgi:hypothetical protein
MGKHSDKQARTPFLRSPSPSSRPQPLASSSAVGELIDSVRDAECSAWARGTRQQGDNRVMCNVRVGYHRLSIYTDYTAPHPKSKTEHDASATREDRDKSGRGTRKRRGKRKQRAE